MLVSSFGVSWVGQVVHALAKDWDKEFRAYYFSEQKYSQKSAKTNKKLVQSSKCVMPVTHKPWNPHWLAIYWNSQLKNVHIPSALSTSSLKIMILLIKHFRYNFPYVIRSLLLFLMLFPVICHLFQKFLHSFVLFLLLLAFGVLFSYLVNNKLWNLDRVSMNNHVIFFPKFCKWPDYQVELKTSVSFQ